MSLDHLHQKLLSNEVDGLHEILSSPDTFKDEKAVDGFVKAILDRFIEQYLKHFKTKHGAKNAFCKILTSKEKDVRRKSQIVNWSNAKDHKSLPLFILVAIIEFMGLEKNGLNLKLDKTIRDCSYNESQIQSCLELKIGLMRSTCIHMNLLDITSEDLLQYKDMIHDDDLIVSVNVNIAEWKEESENNWEEKCLDLVHEITVKAEKCFESAIILDLDGKIDGTILTKLAKYPIVKEIWVDESTEITDKKVIAKAAGIFLTLKRMLYRNGSAYLKVLQENTTLRKDMEATRQNWLMYWTENDENYIDTLVNLYNLSSFNPELREQIDSLLQNCSDPRLKYDTGWHYFPEEAYLE